MKLSIIIPIRNEGDVIAKALDLLSNSIKEINYEIVTVNDYSDDNSYEIIDRLEMLCDIILIKPK